MTNVCIEFTNISFAIYDLGRGRRVEMNIRQSLTRTSILFGVWLLYLVGALLGELVYVHIKLCVGGIRPP